MDPSKSGPISPAVRFASTWAAMIQRDPGHSARYAQRFRDLAAQGHDLVGEARLVDALAPRGATILDAGCGPGRHAAYLHAAGHTVVGVDLDPHLIDVARAEAPGPTYVVGDLTSYSIPSDAPQRFDIVYSAGNVMGFVHPETRRPILAGIADRLLPDGRAVIGFGAGRGYPFDEFESDAVASGLDLHAAFSTWDLRPHTPDSDFLVALFGRA